MSSEIDREPQDTDDIDAYMGNDEILDYLPKEEELLDQDFYKISNDEQDHDRFLAELPKFNLKNHGNINLDSTMTTDHTTDVNEQEFDEEELHVIREMEEASKHENTLPQPEYDEHFEELSKKDERRVSTSSQSRCRQRLYQHPLSKPQFSAGKIQLSLAQARLFGLLSEQGELVDLHASEKALTSEQRLELKKYMYQMSMPKPALEVNEQERLRQEGCTFKPSKSPDALKAMRNQKCGYDFMDRINQRGSFLDRVNQLSSAGKGSGEGKVSKSEYDAMKVRYDESLTKLQCPKCLKPQSFDEFINKKRFCTSCSLKFQKLNVTSGLSFTRKNEEYERKRRERLLTIDKEMYGDIPPKPMPNTLPRTSPTPPLTSAQQAQRRPPSAPEGGDEGVPPSERQTMRHVRPHKPQPRQTSASEAKRPKAATIVITPQSQLTKEEGRGKGNERSKEVLAKIVAINSAKNKEALKALDNPRQAKTMMSEKMERLLST